MILRIFMYSPSKKFHNYYFILFLLVYVITAPEGERVYDKKHSCFFCHKQYAKIAWHLEQVHGHEE